MTPVHPIVGAGALTLLTLTSDRRSRQTARRRVSTIVLRSRSRQGWSSVAAKRRRRPTTA